MPPSIRSGCGNDELKRLADPALQMVIYMQTMPGQLLAHCLVAHDQLSDRSDDFSEIVPGKTICACSFSLRVWSVRPFILVVAVCLFFRRNMC